MPETMHPGTKNISDTRRDFQCKLFVQSVILEVAERLILKILFVPDFAGENERDCPFEADSVNPTW